MSNVNGDTFYKSDLPEDLLIEILIRLPAKSLLRVKCVCKHWYGLIKAHSFEHKFLEYQKSMKQNRLLLQYYNEEDRELNYTILDEDTQSRITFDSLEYLEGIHHSVGLEGPVNGLYCLYCGISGRCVLWNPALMEFKIVPLPPPHFLPSYKAAFAQVGFGVGSLINDHKVVLVRTFFDLSKDGDLVDGHVVNLYNPTTNTWRHFDLDNFPLAYPSFDNNSSSSFLNGTYHWWVHSGVVLAFDMGIETFRIIPGPDLSQSDLTSLQFMTTIAVYNEHVALVRGESRGDDLSLDIWVMLEEGIWFKQFQIGPFVEPMWLLGFWGKDRLLLVFFDTESNHWNPKTRMVLYDVISQEMRNVGPRASVHGFRTCVYYESLISLNRGNEFDVHMVSDFFNPGFY